MDDYTYKQATKECEAAIGIGVGHAEIDENGNKVFGLFCKQFNNWLKYYISS